MLPKWFPSKIFPHEGNYVAVHIDAISRLTPTVVLYVHSESGRSSKGNYFEVSNEINSVVYRAFFQRFESPFIFLNRLINFYRFFKAQKETYEVIKKNQGLPKLTHVHVLLRTSFFALYLKLKHNIPFIVSEHWSAFLMERQARISFFKKFVIKYICTKSVGITCVSEALKKGLSNICAHEKIEVIFNGVDSALFNIWDTKKTDNIKIKFLHISRLDSHPKNLPGILKSIEKLFKTRQDFELHIIGEGREGEKQRNLSRELGIFEKAVFFHGYLNPVDVSNWLKKSAFLIVFSNYESQSKVILESFACGRPVIATNVGGITEMVTKKRGILISSGNEEELLNAINEMLNGGMNLFNAYELSAYSKRMAGYDVIGKQFLNMYESVLHNS